VGSGSFTLDDNTYSMVSGSMVTLTISIAGTTTTSDLIMYQISTTSTTGTNLTLSPLSINSNTTLLTAASRYTNGTSFVSIGYGRSDGSRAESWGINTVSATNVDVYLNGVYETVDFKSNASTGSYVVSGDSGGGDFVYENGTWVLVGLNEVTYTNSNSTTSAVVGSGYIDLSQYYGEIENIMGDAVPEPTGDLLAIAGTAVILLSFAIKRRKPSSTAR
jgi:hypothetical protein